MSHIKACRCLKNVFYQIDKINSLEKLTFSKLWFFKFEKFDPRSVFGELQLTQISLNFQTSCCNLKIRGRGAKLCVGCFYYFNYYERSYVWLFKVKESVLLNENINFNNNETESTMENSTYSFRGTYLMLQFV